MLQVLQKSFKNARMFAVSVLALMLISGTANAQTTLVSFDFTSIPSSTTWPSSPWTTYTTLDANYTSTGLVRGSGVAASGSNAAGCYGGSGGWNSAGTDNNGFAFTITTTCRNTSLAQLSGRSRHSATGPGSVNVFYSLNGAAYVALGNWTTTSTSGTTGTAGNSVLSGITALQNIPAGTSIKFLFVPQGSTGNWYFTGTNTTGLVLTGTYTVVAAPTVTTGPSNSIIAPAAATTFSVSGVAGVTKYQWQRNTSGISGGTWVNITSSTMDPAPGTYGSFTTTTTAATNTLSLNAVPATWNGYGYRCQAINCAGTVNSTPALLTVTSAACATVNAGTITPTPTTFCGGGSQLLTLGGATAGIDVTYQWASSPTGAGGSFTNITGATNSVYTPTVSATTYYQVTSTCTVTSATATSSTAVLSVNPIPAVSSITGGNTMCTGTPLALSDATTGTHVWSSSNTAVGTINSSTGVVTGLTAGTTSITYKYTDATTTCTANAVTTVSVNVTPSFTVTPSTASMCAGSTVSVSVLPISGTAFSENFESTTVGGIPTGWTSGGAGPSFFNVVTAPQTWSTTTVNTIGGSSKYLWVRTASPFNTVATITTPAFSLAGYSSANLAYLGFYDLGTSETLVVQISTTGPTGTFTTIYNENNNWAGGATYSTTSYPRSIDLSAYVGQANVAIRWSFTTSSGWAFIIDNVSVTGTATTPTWVKSDATFNDLYTSAAHTTLLSGIPAASAYVYDTTPGTYTYYGQKNGCNSPYGTTVTVNPMPVVSPILGTPVACIGQTASLGEATSGGVWSSSNTGIVTVGSGDGKIFGISAGTANISYTVTSPFGCSTSVSVVATINPIPVVPAISGVSNICIGSSATLSDAASFGTWESDNEPVAAISTGVATDNSDVVINGVTTGISNIRYTLTNSYGCSAYATAQVTINSLPVISGITGTSDACLGLATQLTDATAGGTWSSDNTTAADVDAAGLVTGNALGTANIIYTVTDGLGCTDFVTVPVTVNPLPAGIAGVATICAAGTVSLSDADAGGTWTISNTNASIDASGVVSGSTAGTSTISYTLPTGCYVTALINITPTPTASPINDGPICFGGTVVLTANGAGGTIAYNWSGPALSSATNANPSAVTSVTSTYSLTVTDGTTNSGCSSSYTTSVTVNSFGVSATNDGPACAGGTVNLGATSTGLVSATGYSWSGPAGFSSTLQNPVIAGAATDANGTYTVHTTAGSGCSAYATTVVTIKTIGVNVSNSGPACVGGNVTLSSTATGTASPISYSWSGPLSFGSTTAGSMLSSISSATAGVYTISVTAPGSGCTATNTTSVVVNTLSITAGNDGPVCAGNTIHFTSVPAGTATPVSYVWNGPASLPGIQNPLLGGATAAMSGTYTVTVSAAGSGCTAFATTSLLVNTFGLIAGNDGPVCAGNTAHLTATPTGTLTPTAYSWSGPGGYTSTDANPVITGVTTAMAGLYTVTTTAGSGCTASATTMLSVTPLPAAISGSSLACVGATITLSDATTGGVWSNSTPSVATLGLSAGSTKSLLGLSAGTTTISYTVGAGCTTSVVITVNPTAVISGMTPLCIGATLSLSTDIAGGKWFSTVTSHATVDGSGGVTAIGNGTSSIVYTLPTGCASASVATVNAVPSGIGGVPKTCTGQFTTLNDIAGGGVWTSSNPAVGSVNVTTGLFVNVTGLTVGTTTISYTLGSGCPATLVVSVNPISPVLGIAPVCVGTAVSLSDATADGTWSSSNTRASVDGSGNVTGVSAGTAIISYITSAGCVASAIATVQATPAAISGIPRVCIGSSATLSDPSTGGTWSSSNTNASIDGAGTVTGGSVGTATISYTFSNGCAATKTATVNDIPSTPTGTIDLCAGATTTFTDAADGGTWSASPVSVATIGITSGLLTAVASGAATVTYSTGPGCTATAAVTVEAISPISGSTSVCIGGSSDLGDASGGGTWSTSDATITLDGTTGLVTGVSEGTAAVTYTIPSGCSRTVTIAINPAPTPITGTFAVCPGTTTALTDIGAGTWSSGSPSIATVGAASGIVTGTMAGTTNITYTAGVGCIVVARVTVNPAPSGIGGPTAVCEGSTITVTNFTAGGVWSTASSNISIDGSGSVSGITSGSASVTYTLGTTGCFVTRAINVNPLPAAISGNTTLCAGAVTFLSDATTGGISWTSSNTSVATVTASGAVTGVSLGTANITYTSGAGCKTATTVTVTAMPSGVTGNTPACPGTTLALSDASGSGTWNSSNTAVATVDPATGVVTGIVTGTATISYLAGGAGCIATTIVTISAANPITGALSTCQGGTTALHNSSTGGVWSSSSSNVSVGSSGVVAGVAAGTALVTYTLTSGCVATATVTVNSLPAGITGSTPMCAGSGISLGETASGGTWSSSNTARATVDVAGNVTGISAGTAAISYIFPTGCYVTTSVTVNATPLAISGASTLCVGLTASLSDATVGGTWSSSTSSASIGSTGVVTGVSAGTAAISYTLSTGCAAGKVITVVDVPSAVSGTAYTCVGSSTVLSDALGGGTWTSSNLSVGTVGSITGVVTGIAAGTTTISYRLGSGCGSAIVVTVTALPAAISGTLAFCAGATTSLSDATAGGTWTSDNAVVATVSATGLVSGVGSSGTATISYSVGLAGCTTTKVVTLNPAPAAIAGTASACIGAMTALTDATTGGTWSSSATGTATVIGSSGVVTGVAAGTARISYTAAGCSSVVVLTVNPAPTPIGGATTVCQNASITLSDNTAGGTWSSTSNASIVSAGTLATVTGVTVGTATISYVLPTGCFKTFTETIKPLPTPILGTLVVCGIGGVTFLSDATAGTSWTISPVGTATISASGRVYGAALGTATVTYTGSNGCIINAAVTVNAIPVVSPISGASSVSIVGAPITLTDATGGGTWSSTFPAKATIGSSSGVVTGVAAGTTTISYLVTTAGCSAAAAKIMTVTATAPRSGGTTVSGTTTVLTGASVSIPYDAAGGIWSSNNTTVATVSDNGMVTGIAAGIADITHVVTTTDGEVSTSVTPVVVSAIAADVRVVPNPNKGTFTVKGSLGSTQDEDVSLEVTDVLGQVIYKNTAIAFGGKISEVVSLNGTLANGMYILNVHTSNEKMVFHFVMEK